MIQGAPEDAPATSAPTELGETTRETLGIMTGSKQNPSKSLGGLTSMGSRAELQELHDPTQVGGRVEMFRASLLQHMTRHGPKTREEPSARRYSRHEVLSSLLETHTETHTHSRAHTRSSTSCIFMVPKNHDTSPRDRKNDLK